MNIVNPRGMLILGNSKEFDDDMKCAMELLRRQHSRILDIITYDDLIREFGTSS